MRKVMELKERFVGPKTLLYQKGVVDLSKPSVDFTPDLELPIEVDSLKATMDDPTINHYKVIGLGGDWATTSELGDFTTEFVVPSQAKELLEAMFGTDAVSEITKFTIKQSGDTSLDVATGFKGNALEIKKFKMVGTVVIVDETKENLMVITNLSLYATMVWDDTGTKPVAFKFSGSVEGAGLKSVAWLTKIPAE